MKSFKLILFIALFICMLGYINIALCAETSLKGGETLIGTESNWGDIVKKAYGISSSGGVGLLETIAFIIGAALTLVGALFLILIIYGGVLWMTAGGNEEQVKKAKKYIINATIGLIIVVIANVIVAFALNILQPGTGTETTT